MPFRLLLTAALLGLGAAAQAAIPAAERTTLLNLYAYTQGNGWNNNTGWNGPIGTECSWYGITCDTQQSTVIAIDLHSNSLLGTLPPLDALTNLQSLTLEGGGATLGSSPVPNFLTGAIPPLKSLTHLQVVDLTTQSFTGPIPDLTGLSQLTALAVSYNNLSGAIPSIQGLNQLTYFDVGHNLLSGNIPVLTGLNQLQYFRVFGNALTGSIPALAGLNQLQTFLALQNQLSGSMPDLSGLAQLNEFDISSNLLNGELPATIANSPNLQTFNASYNFLGGNVSTLAAVPQLQTFNVGANQLTGAVPAPPTNAGFKEGLCPNALTPATNPPTAIDLALDAVTGVTPWSQGCTQTPAIPTISGTEYIDPATADGKTVTVKAWVYGRHPTGTITFYLNQNFPVSSSTVVCDQVPLANGVATCSANALSALTSDNTGSPTWGGIGAVYSGDANNTSGGVGNWNSLVSYYQLQLTSSASVIATGQPFDLVGTLTGWTANGGWYGDTHADALSFYDGNVALCSHIPISILGAPPGQEPFDKPQVTAHCVATFLTPGDHVLTERNDNLLSLGTTSPAVTQTVVATTPFDANQFALTGTWYNAYTSGQGLELEVSPDTNGAGTGQLFGGWFTYDALGNPQWYSLQGKATVAHGASYTLTIFNTSGGNFNAAPVASTVSQGSATLTFYDCSHASLIYQFNDGRSGTIPEARLSSASNCSTVVPAQPSASVPTNYNDVLHSGAWYSPQTSGQGVLFDVIPAQSIVFAAWFTYAPQTEGQTGSASQRWFTLQAGYTPGNLSLKQVPIYAVIGGLFNAPTRTATLPVGMADITFTSCSTMTLTYSFTQSELSGLTGSINEQSIAPLSDCQ